MKGVELKKMIQELNLYNKTPDIDISAKRINTPEINRPLCSLPAIWSILPTNGSRSSVMWSILIFCICKERRK